MSEQGEGATAQDRPGRALLPAVPPRLARRRRLLAWSAPLVAIALLLGPLLLGTVYANTSLRGDAMESGTDGALEAAQGYAALQPITRYGVQPWIAHYNEGTALLRGGDALAASAALTDALGLVPQGVEGEDGEVDNDSPECRVRINLSLSYEALADGATTAGSLAAAEGYLLDAIEAIGPCTLDREPEVSESPTESPSESQTEPPSEPPSEEPTTGEPSPEPGEGETPSAADPSPGSPDEIEQRQTEKYEDNQESQAGENPSPAQPPEGASEEPTSLSPQEQELQSRNEESLQDQRNEEQREGGGYGGGQNW